MIVHGKENKSSRNEEGPGSRTLCPKATIFLWSEFIFFGETFLRAKGVERACGIWKRKKGKKRKRRRGRKRKRISYETLARVTLPFTLHPAQPASFLRIPLLSQASVFHRLFAGLCSLRGADDGTSKACDFILVKTKILILPSKRLSYLFTLNIIKYQHITEREFSFAPLSNSRCMIYVIANVCQRVKKAEIVHGSMYARIFLLCVRTCREGWGFSFEKWTRIAADVANVNATRPFVTSSRKCISSLNPIAILEGKQMCVSSRISLLK